jgi:small subunit ribosomal protein S18
MARRFQRYNKKRTVFNAERPVPTYQNIEGLKNYVSPDTWRIAPGRMSRNDARWQRQIALAIKRARFLALLPYCDRHFIEN